MKKLLFHAIRPDPIVRGTHDWTEFLREAALLDLPPEVERLAENVWILPDDAQYLALSSVGQRHGIATQTLVFVPASDWQPLSRSP